MITLAHGAGGEQTRELVETLFLPRLKNRWLLEGGDAAVIDPLRLAISTDGYTVSPLFFPGGDIGKLAVIGSCNDVVVSGARPRFLSAGFIIEEGFKKADLERIVDSMAAALEAIDVALISADTKVVPRGSADGIYITTTALGEQSLSPLRPANLQEGAVLVASGFVGDHGTALFSAREEIGFSGDLKSDCAHLWPLIEALIQAKQIPLALRDATRGGVAAVLNEWAISSGLCPLIEQAAIPIRKEVHGACELLGFDPLTLANEGMMIAAFRPEQAQGALATLRAHPTGAHAAIIGTVGASHPGKVVLQTPHGTARFLEMPAGELLPRIC